VQPGDELIWGMDFNSPNASMVVAALSLRTYGQLAACSEQELQQVGLGEDLGAIKAQLEKRGLTLDNGAELTSTWSYQLCKKCGRISSSMPGRLARLRSQRSAVPIDCQVCDGVLVEQVLETTDFCQRFSHSTVLSQTTRHTSEGGFVHYTYEVLCLRCCRDIGGELLN